MDISPTVEEPVPNPAVDNFRALNAQLTGINVIDFSNVKKKLDFGEVTEPIDADKKGKGVAFNGMAGFTFSLVSGEKKLPEFSQQVSSGKEAVSGFQSNGPTFGLYSLSNNLSGLTQKDELQFNQRDGPKKKDWANLLAKPVAEMEPAPVTASYISKIGPNEKTWKRRARNHNLELNSSGSVDIRNKRIGEVLAGGSQKRARPEDNDSSIANEPTVEAVNQPRREP